MYAYVRRDRSSTIHIIMLFDFSNLVMAPKFTEPFCYTIKLCELSLTLDVVGKFIICGTHVCLCNA